MEATSDTEALQTALRAQWHAAPSEKARRYIGKFFETTRTGSKIAGKVKGSHGIYTVSIESTAGRGSSACSCYIGKHGFCHPSASAGQATA